LLLLEESLLAQVQASEVFDLDNFLVELPAVSAGHTSCSQGLLNKSQHSVALEPFYIPGHYQLCI